MKRPVVSLLLLILWLGSCDERTVAEKAIATPGDLRQGATTSVNIIAMDPNGFGSRITVPFASRSVPGQSVEYWQAMAKPVFAATDFERPVDVNLFSLCQIALRPEQIENDRMLITIDLKRLSVPKWIKAPEREVVTALLICFIQNGGFDNIKKPNIEFSNWRWDTESLQKVLDEYDQASRGKTAGLTPSLITKGAEQGADSRSATAVDSKSQ